MKLAVLNQSTVVPDVGPMVGAVRHQLHYDVCPVWGFMAPQMRHFADPAAIPADWDPIVILDDADQADALGYHDETPDGRPYARVFAKTVLDNGGTVSAGPNSVSVTLSHEAVELVCDPNVELWADNGAAEEVAFEACDPCQGDAYDVIYRTHPVTVSDFVYPAYFDRLAPAPYDHMGVLTAPHSIAQGGYLIVRSAGQIGQRTNFCFADQAPPDWQAASKLFAAARTARRLTESPSLPH